MSKHDKSNRSNVSEKGQSKRVGTSVLVAAASLLGTSLGVSAAAAAEPKVTVTTPHISVKPHVTAKPIRTPSNQLKGVQPANQSKTVNQYYTQD